MKICPKCRTQFTDTSLSYCLQDGSVLVDGADNKTEKFTDDDISAAETIATDAGTTDPVSHSIPARSAAQIQPEPSQPTVVRDDAPIPRRGFGFLSGFLAGALILGALGLIGLGAWLLPGVIWPDAGVNSNVNSKSNGATLVDREQVASVTASSVRKQDAGNLYIPENALDNDDRTAWCEGASGPGLREWIKIEFADRKKLSEMKIKPGYFKNASIWRKNNRVASVELLFSNGQTRVFDFPDEMKTQTVPLNGVESSFVKLTLREFHRGSADQKDTLISEIAFTAEN